MGNLRDKYTDEEWDALVEQSNKIEPIKYPLTEEEYIDDKFKIKSVKAMEKHITKITAVEVMCIKMADVVRVIWAVDNKLNHYDIKGSVIYVIKEDALQKAVDAVMNSYINHLKK
jgi:hypothetical protein